MAKQESVPETQQSVGETPTAQRRSADSGKVVKYVGTADERVIDAKAWKSIGVENQGKVVWNKDNKFTVPVTDLEDGAVVYCDEQDSGFVVTDADTK